MAFSERMVLKKATTMSLHERFSQMRHEKITQPPEPKYSAPPVRSAPPPLPPPLPPRISDYYDDDSGIFLFVFVTSFSRNFVIISGVYFFSYIIFFS